MLATRDEAAVKFANFVKLAKGDAYLVYLALSTLDDPSDENVENYIREHLREKKAA